MRLRFLVAVGLLAFPIDGICSEPAAPPAPSQEAAWAEAAESSPDQPDPKASSAQATDVSPAETGDPATKTESEATEQKANSAKVELIAIEKNIIDYTNQERARYGLPPLEVCPKLMESARRHATWMTLHRSLRHTSDPVAENIALGQRSSWEAVRDWMRSSGHRANILNPRHRWIGAAAYRTPEGDIYWCQQFRP